MSYDAYEIVARHAAGGAAHPNGRPLAPDAARGVAVVREGTGRLGRARVRDSTRREWILEPWRDAARGRFAVLRLAHGDLEPFRASADGHRPDAWLGIGELDWQVLALLAAGHDGDGGRPDEELATAAARLVDWMAREAQRRQLLGLDEEEEGEGG